MKGINLKKVKWPTEPINQVPVKRCAIYTRKSVDEGLDAMYTTLDAQRDYCETYIRSNSDKGWEALPEHYDDGGFSGKNMERPAMQRLLQDVADHKVDIVVAYKLDRFSRSLIDFANFSAFLEQNGASFVVVTERVDTTTPAGRMQISLLMLFAQYEREMTATRIRDKMTAMRKHGFWTGGNVPYGYESKEKKLIIFPEKAKIVKRIFNRYIETGSPLLIARELNGKGITSPTGKKWTSSTITKILNNQIYIGKITLRDEEFEGLHEPIIPMELWVKANEVKKVYVPRIVGSLESPVLALFKEHIICGECGKCMTLSSSTRDNGKRRYTYYRCITTERAGVQHERCRTHNLPVEDLENEILRVACAELESPTVIETLRRGFPDLTDEDIQLVLEMPEELFKMLPVPKRYILAKLLVKKAVVFDTAIVVTLNGDIYTNGGGDLIKEIPLRVIQSSSRVSLMVGQRQLDVALPKESINILAAIHTARQWKKMLEEGRVGSLYELGKYLNIDKSYIRKRFRLSLVSPRIIVAILNHHENMKVSISMLQKNALLPWPQQEAAVGLLV